MGSASLGVLVRHVRVALGICLSSVMQPIHPCWLQNKKIHIPRTKLQSHLGKKRHCEFARSRHFCCTGLQHLDGWLHSSTILCMLLRLFLWLLTVLRWEIRGLAAWSSQWHGHNKATHLQFLAIFFPLFYLVDWTGHGLLHVGFFAHKWWAQHGVGCPQVLWAVNVQMCLVLFQCTLV